ncbi:GntR family transcriptional regulator, partial [Nocardia abscessus]|uniref:GntR family transcriptional regulator n=1 Tax=Nocardia abscessus TaxID=120957 RepID=UPI0024589946
MSSSARRPEPPYRTIVAEIRARIETGDLRPGDRVPSIRQIAQRWGVGGGGGGPPKGGPPPPGGGGEGGGGGGRGGGPPAPPPPPP